MCPHAEYEQPAGAEYEQPVPQRTAAGTVSCKRLQKPSVWHTIQAQHVLRRCRMCPTSSRMCCFASKPSGLAKRLSTNLLHSCSWLSITTALQHQICLLSTPYEWSANQLMAVTRQNSAGQRVCGQLTTSSLPMHCPQTSTTKQVLPIIERVPSTVKGHDFAHTITSKSSWDQPAVPRAAAGQIDCKLRQSVVLSACRADHGAQIRLQPNFRYM